MIDLTKHARVALLAAVLGGVSTAASAAVIYDATGGAENGGDPLSAAGPILADRFVNTTASTLTSVTLNLSLIPPANSGFTVDLFTDAGSTTGPGLATLIASVLDTSLTSSFQLLTVTPVSPIALAANTSYYVGIRDLGGSSAILGNTVDPAVLSRPSVSAGAFYYNNGGVQANAGGPYEILVTAAPLNATPVPEPAGWTTLLGAVAVLGFTLRRHGHGAV